MKTMRPPQPALTDHSWPFAGSFALHALLFTILSLPAFEYPTVISSLDQNILWLFPAFSSSETAEPAMPVRRRLHAYAAQPPEREPTEQPAVVSESTTPPPAQMTVPDVSADGSDNPDIAGLTVPGVSGILPDETLSPSRTVPPPASAPVENMAALLKPGPEPHVATATPLPELRVQEKTVPHPAQQAGVSAIAFSPIIKGDLKLVVVGTTRITTTVTFREFALSRRDRPFSRSEAHRELKIVPYSATTKDDTLEVVIEQTRPGVYTFTVEPATGQTSLVFSLKLHDGTAYPIVKELGKQALARKTVLCRILMPEGILWSDDQEFTGNMEDSESVTKFNTTTGLMWKEYNN